MSAENNTPETETEATSPAESVEDQDAVTEDAEAEDASDDAASDDAEEGTEAEEGIEAETPAVEAEPAEPEPPKHPNEANLKWYAVHTFSNFEEKARNSLLEKVKQEGMEHFFGDVLVPIEEIVEHIGTKKKVTKKRFFPGYMFVQMQLTDEAWHLVNDTAKVTGFVGDKRNPVPLRKREVAKLTQKLEEAAVEKKPRVVYVEGEKVKVTDGSFAGFNAEVEEVKEEQQRLRVRVSIFGRPTPVDLSYDQVEKIMQ